MDAARAFTLLEMLMATALSTVLMIGVMAVVADLGSAGLDSSVRQRKPLETGGDPAPGIGRDALGAWVGLLREDLRHATEVVASRDNELTLWGYGALDSRSRERTHRPVRVRYGIETVGGRSWLVRRQSLLDALTNQNVQRDLVCGGVRRFELVSVRGESAPGPADADSSGRQAVEKEGGSGSQETEVGEGQMENDAPGESGGSERNATDRDGAASGVRRSTGSGRESYFYRGNWYYAEHLPDHIRERLTSEGTGERSSSSPDAERTAAPPGQGSGFGDEGASERGGAAGGGSVENVWRLRVWTGDGEEPAHERVVILR